jgi:hypothetical protein
MQDKIKRKNMKIRFFKGIRLLFIPLSLTMFYFTTKAWGDAIGFLLAVAFGWSFFLVMNSAIVDVIGGELKSGVEELIRKVTASPVHIEFGRAWGRMSFLIFLQEDNETVTKIIYRKVVERLRTSEYFSKIEIVSMANVPDLEKETIAKFKNMMMKNALEIARRQRKEK